MELSLFDPAPDARLDSFSRLMHSPTQPNKQNWRARKPPVQRTIPTPTAPERIDDPRPAPTLGKSRIPAPHAPEKTMPNAAAIARQQETAELGTNPMQLGDDLEAALAAKMMEGVLEFFKDRVREKMKTGGFATGESEHAQVRISAGGGPSRVVNYDRFIAACREKKVKVAERNKLISICKGKPLEAHFSANEIEAMCDDGPTSTAACNIEQKKTLVTPIGVPEAITILHDYFERGVITDRTFLKKKSSHR